MTVDGKACPFCQSQDTYRIHRRFWMRLIPFSRFYHCRDCLRTFFVMFPPRDHKTTNAPSERFIGYELPGGEIVCRWCITQKEHDEDKARGEEHKYLQVGNLTCNRCKRPLKAPDPTTESMNHLLNPPPKKKDR
jgi:hypothetical protein